MDCDTNLEVLRLSTVLDYIYYYYIIYVSYKILAYLAKKKLKCLSGFLAKRAKTLTLLRLVHYT